MAATPAAAPLELDACWNRIGVRGDRSCPELVPHVHCRNCPVFSAAATRLLDRELPAGHLAEWTRHFARAAQGRDAGSLSVLVFRVGAEWLALRTTWFEEVAEARPIHSLPHRRDGIVLGIANVRGELLSCISLARLLGTEAAPAAAAGRDERRVIHKRLLVVGSGAARAVLPVDEVQGIQRFQPEALKPAPATVSQSQPCFTRGVLASRQRSIGLIDEQLLASAIARSLA